MGNAIRKPIESADLVPREFEPPPGMDMSDVYDSRKMRIQLVHRPVTPVSEREFETAAEYEAFMEQMVIIQIHTSGDKNAPWVVPVGVNGDTRWLQRGRKILIERKYLECLCRWDMTYSTEENPDPRDTNGMNMRTHASQSYPFTVLFDPSPKGQAWLARITREGV